MRLRALILAAFLGLFAAPAIAANCPTYPFTLTNGQTADANQVMANFNSILTCANGSLAKNAANNDITSLSGLTTPLSVAQGGTGVTTSIFGSNNTWTGTNAFGTLTSSAATITGFATFNTAGIAAVFQPPLTTDFSYLEFKRGAGGNLAWDVGMFNAANGYSFFVNRYNSSGTLLDVPFLISNSTGDVTGHFPFEFYVFVGGIPGNAWKLAAYQPSTALVLTTGKSSCTAGTAATASTTFTLKDNGSSIGTAVVGAGVTTCTATITSSPYSFTAGHTLSLDAPGTADATAADIGITFGGTRN